ncbi:MAG: N-acetyltransferase [Prevotella sp.]
MKEIDVKRVTSRRQMNDFVNLPRHIYKGNTCYVPDLDLDIRQTFDSRHNAGLENSEMEAFVAYDEEGHTVGRVAAIVNHAANRKWQVRNVRFGMLEFIDDLRVSEALMEAVAQWGRERGMSHMQGPMGIFDFDKEGMLVDDFDLVSSMITLYNPPYYPQHMTRLGFEKEADWIQISIKVPQTVPAKYARVADYCRLAMGLTVTTLTRRQIESEGYGHKLFQLLNEAYSPLFGFTELTERQIDQFVSRYLNMIDLRMVPVVFDQKGDMVGVAVTMGSMNDALRKSRGRLLPMGWWHLLKSLKLKREKKAELLLIAVRPDLQGMGINALFFDHLIPIYNKLGFEWAETGPQLEDNVKELSQWKPLDPKIVKRRRCYGRSVGQLPSSKNIQLCNRK